MMSFAACGPVPSSVVTLGGSWSYVNSGMSIELTRGASLADGMSVWLTRRGAWETCSAARPISALPGARYGRSRGSAARRHVTGRLGGVGGAVANLHHQS